jgi:hypothetical protein
MFARGELVLMMSSEPSRGMLGSETRDGLNTARQFGGKRPPAGSLGHRGQVFEETLKKRALRYAGNDDTRVDATETEIMSDSHSRERNAPAARHHQDDSPSRLR